MRWTSSPTSTIHHATQIGLILTSSKGRMALETSSPLSTDSSEVSFYTANASAHDTSGHDISTTSIGSPEQHEKLNERRTAKPLARDLKNQSDVLLEEELYREALALFTSILSSGSLSEQHTISRPIAIPGAKQLALINTLCIHPDFTTRPEHPDHRRVSARAFSYLYSVLESVGPINADFRTAFQFQAPTRRARRGGNNITATNSEASDVDNEDDDQLQGKLSNQGSIWSRGQDFWSIVGWAFHCSVKYPNRWQYWKLWLTFMLDVIHADWDERQKIDEAAGKAAGDDTTPTTSRQGSIIAMYLEGHDTRQKLVNILKAVEANGDARSAATYREVFYKEPLGRRKDRGTKRKRDDLDIEKEQYGDYQDDDDDLESGRSEPPTPKKRGRGRPPKQQPITTERSAAEDAFDLRLRLFRYISASVCYLSAPERLSDLYEAYRAKLTEDSLDTFTRIVTMSDPEVFPNVCRVTVIKALFRQLLPRSAKDPWRVDPDVDNQGALSGKMVEHCYAGYAAISNDVEDNARLSVLVESALQSTWLVKDLQYSGNLKVTVEKGIEAREAKAKKKAQKAQQGSKDAVAWDALCLSGQRIRILMEVLQG